MKITLGIFLAITSFAMADDSYINKIVQITENPDDPNNPAISYLNPIAATGSSAAPEEVPTSSVFQLWTVHGTTGAEYMLDEKTVSTYHPQAEVSITSLDPYEAIPRTRVDQPFNVTYTVAGIVTDDPSVQEAAKSVIFDHRVYAYAAGEDEAPENAPYDTHDHDPITENGEHTLTGLVTQISGSDLTSVRGEELFSIYANPDFGVVGASLLASERVQIWPVASGTITGVDPNKRYALVPTIRVRTTDLYPASDTFLRYYMTSDPTNPRTSGVIGNRRLSTTVPVTKNWKIRRLDRRIKVDGVYTLELLHTTVFNTIRLGDPIQLTVDRTIELNGGVISAE